MLAEKCYYLIVKKIDHFFSSYKNGKGIEWIDLEIIHDNNIRRVMLNDKDANIINLDIYNMRIYYLLGNETEKIIPPEYSLIY